MYTCALCHFMLLLLVNYAFYSKKSGGHSHINSLQRINAKIKREENKNAEFNGSIIDLNFYFFLLLFYSIKSPKGTCSQLNVAAFCVRIFLSN